MDQCFQTITPNHSFQKEFITNHLIKNRSIDEIYSLIFAPCQESSQNSQTSFICQLYSRRNDTNILCYLNLNEENQKKQEHPQYQEYNYSYAHPVWKKVVIGPNVINVNDKYKLFFISPQLFIVEVMSTFSGFLFMDTFYSKMQYRFEQSNDNHNNLFLTVKFLIEFTKTNPFKVLTISSAYEENNQFVNKIFVNMLDETLRHQNRFDILNDNYDYKSEDEERINDILFKNPFCSKNLVNYCLYEIYC